MLGGIAVNHAIESLYETSCRVEHGSFQGRTSFTEGHSAPASVEGMAFSCRILGEGRWQPHDPSPDCPSVGSHSEQ